MPSRRKITALEQISGSASRRGSLARRAGQGRSAKRAWIRASGMAPPEPQSHHGSRFSEWFAPQAQPNVSVYIQPPQPLRAGQPPQGRLSDLGYALSSVQQTLRQFGAVPGNTHQPALAQPALAGQISYGGGSGESARAESARPLESYPTMTADPQPPLYQVRSEQETHPPQSESQYHRQLNSASVAANPINEDSPLPAPTPGDHETATAAEAGPTSRVGWQSKPSNRPGNKPSPRAPVHSLADALALGLRSDTMPHARHRTQSARPWGRIDGQSNRRHIAAVAERTLDRRMTIALIVTVVVIGATVVTLLV